MNRLTRQEQLFLLTVLGLFLLGLVVKYFRTSRPLPEPPPLRQT